jgi:outer membrane protein assembly factor BamB
MRVFLFLCCLPLLCLAADWPQWRGPSRDNHWPSKAFPATLPTKPVTLWKNPIGGGYGGIAVSDGRLYVMDRQKAPEEVERILCLDATTGKELWSHRYAVAYKKLDYGNGPRSTPTVKNGKVWTFGAMGHLFCLDAKTGKVIWSKDCVNEFKAILPIWGHACSPLLDEKQLIVQIGGRPDACIVSFDPETGKELWRSCSDKPGYASPTLFTIGKEKQLIYFLPTRIVGLNPSNGKELWSEPFEGIEYGVSLSDMVMVDGVLLASNYWSGSKAIKLNDEGKKPSVVWEGKELSLLMSTPLVRGKHIYALDRFKGLKCIEASSGKVLWENEHVTPRDRNPHASLAWVDDYRALIFNTPGELLLVKLSPTKLETISKIKVSGKTWAHPAFAQGCVFARNDEEIVCVRLVEKNNDDSSDAK